MAPTDPLRIGITCYPSVGGSGVLATALGEELAAHGQVFAECCGQHATAADGRVAGDADAQRVGGHFRDGLQPESSVNASSDRSMVSRSTYVIPGASWGRRYACSPAPVT